jgi:hypothetical protein
LNDLLESLRTRTAVVERRPGIFYLKGRAFLHFHEDPSGLFADLRHGSDWRRFSVNDPGERANLLGAIDQTLQGCRSAGAAGKIQAIRAGWR